MQTRPQELIDWGHRRDFTPSIRNVDDFHQRWVTWWRSCQPKWRSTKKWPYDQNDAKDSDWSKLNATGPHGLFAVIMSASWWVNSMDSESFHDTFSPAIEDLRWVTESLIYFNSQLQETESTPSPTPTPLFPGHRNRESGKRQVKPSYKAANGS